MNDATDAIKKVIAVGEEIAKKGSKVGLAMMALISSIKQNKEISSTIETRTAIKAKTQKGARHNQGVHFLSRSILSITPAQYRHRHFGSKKRKVK